MAERLREAGIADPAALAALDRPGVDALAKRLGIEAARIRREGWVGGAAKLT
jgi:predicted flap endonuclease-1-like 5' DNA nuclease